MKSLVQIQPSRLHPLLLVVKDIGLWTRRREFDFLRGYGVITMKISLLVPEQGNLQNTRDFLKQEVCEARNIKSNKTRKHVDTGLKKILNCL